MRNYSLKKPMTDLTALQTALKNANFLSNEDKKKWYEQAQNMPAELVDILIKSLTAETPEEFEALKERIAMRKQELKTYADNLVNHGIQKIYAEAEQLSSSDDSQQKDKLLQNLDNA